MNSFERFEETQLPPQAAFYSQLKEQELSDEDYEHTMDIWSSFGLHSMGQYHDLYLKTDVVLLSDVFEKLSKHLSEQLRTRPGSLLHGSWSVMGRMSKAKQCHSRTAHGSGHAHDV